MLGVYFKSIDGCTQNAAYDKTPFMLEHILHTAFNTNQKLVSIKTTKKLDL